MKVKVIEVETIKLDPNANYLVVLDDRSMTKDTAYNLQTAIDRMGSRAVVFMSKGNPHETIAIYQLPKEDYESS